MCQIPGKPLGESRCCWNMLRNLFPPKSRSPDAYGKGRRRRVDAELSQIYSNHNKKGSGRKAIKESSHAKLNKNLSWSSQKKGKGSNGRFLWWYNMARKHGSMDYRHPSCEKNVSLLKKREVNFPIWCITFIAFFCAENDAILVTFITCFSIFPCRARHALRKNLSGAYLGASRGILWSRCALTYTQPAPNEYYKLLKVCVYWKGVSQQSQEILENCTRSKITLSWTGRPLQRNSQQIQIENSV
jgi:hypothetical protein